MMNNTTDTSKTDYLISIFTKAKESVNTTLDSLKEVKESEKTKNEIDIIAKNSQMKIDESIKNIQMAQEEAELKKNESIEKTTTLIATTLNLVNEANNVLNNKYINTSNEFKIPLPMEGSITNNMIEGNGITTSAAPVKKQYNEKYMMGLNNTPVQTEKPSGLVNTPIDEKNMNYLKGLNNSAIDFQSSLVMNSSPEIAQSPLFKTTTVSGTTTSIVNAAPYNKENSVINNTIEMPNFEVMPKYQQITSMAQQTIPKLEEEMPKYQQITLMAQQTIPKLEEVMPKYQQITSMAQQTVQPTTKSSIEMIEFKLGYSETYKDNKTEILQQELIDAEGNTYLLPTINKKGLFKEMNITGLAKDQGWGNYCSNYSVGIMRNKEWLIKDTKPTPRIDPYTFTNIDFNIVSDTPIMLEETDQVIFEILSPNPGCATTLRDISVKLYINVSPTETFTNTSNKKNDNKQILLAILLFIIIIIIILLINCKK